MFDLELFEKGKLAFNSAEFFDAHDIWEEIWQGIRLDPEKQVETKDLQALIQLSVSLHLIQQNRLVGAKKVLERARLNIESANGQINGVNTSFLYQEIIRFLDKSDLENCLNVKIITN